MKKLTPLILLLALLNSCNKSDDFDPAVHAEIASPYLEEVLIDLGIDSDGKINGQALKSEVERVNELVIQINLAREVEQCKQKYDYDLINENLLAGLDKLINLRKAVLIIQPNFNDDKTNFELTSAADCGGAYITTTGNNFVYNFNDDVTANIEQLNKLEEFYIANRLGRGYRHLNLKISNCPNLIKIGTANPTKGIVDYPVEDIIRIDESNFFMDSPSYNKFYSFSGSDNSGEASNILGAIRNINLELADLPKLESLHLYQAYLKEFEITNAPELKKLYLFKKRYNFTNDFFLFDDDLSSLEELYIHYRFYEPFTKYDGKVLDLSNFSKLSKVNYKYYAPESVRNTIPPDSKLILSNNNNLKNDLQIAIKMDFFPGTVWFEDMKAFEICLDDDVTEDFLDNNIQIIWENGTENYNAITLNCN